MQIVACAADTKKGTLDAESPHGLPDRPERQINEDHRIERCADDIAEDRAAAKRQRRGGEHRPVEAFSNHEGAEAGQRQSWREERRDRSGGQHPDPAAPFAIAPLHQVSGRESEAHRRCSGGKSQPRHFDNAEI
ncbi:MAG: hypothetical protein P8X54_07030 [Desulfuromonadales bacterium]